MSTPQVAPPMVQAHRSQYDYPPHSTYTNTNPRAYANNSLPAPRVNGSYHTIPQSSGYNRLPPPQPQGRQPSYGPSMTSSVQAEDSRRRTNWADFYKNGVPKEIIVIDDDSPPPPQRTDSYKKRRLDDRQEIEYADSPVYSTAHAQFDASSSASASLHSNDRTQSLQTTTAPTSLDSYGSVGAQAYENPQIGQKRKRAPPQKETRAQVKRKQQEAATDPFSDYIPPSRPPKKAQEVHVPIVRDNVHKNQKVDDDDGHYIVEENTAFTDRYDIVRLLGQGTFGKVVEAYDRRKKTRCAVKIIRSVQKYRDASRIELRVLSTLALNDKSNRNKCIHLRDAFDFRNHICIVTDLLGQSVFDFLKSNGFVPFPSSQIQNFARQLFTSVAFLHDLNLIHTDLKPENILLVHNAYQTFTYNRNIPSSTLTTQRSARQRRVLLDSEIRLIDFGSATFDDEYHSSVVSTRHYRAPEIILQLGWSFPCDIWSIGCIIVEFFTGDALFQTHDNLEHLAMMEAVCNGKIEPKMIRQVIANGRGQANSASKFFLRNRLDYPTPETSKQSKKYVKAMKHLHDFIPNTTPFNRQLLDLLRKIFVYDPKSRITAKQALKHPWFKETLVDDGTEAIRIREEREAQSQAQAATLQQQQTQDHASRQKDQEEDDEISVRATKSDKERDRRWVENDDRGNGESSRGHDSKRVRL